MTSVLSGRSAMTLLSVLSRRKTYGCTNLRSGAYPPCVPDAMDLQNPLKALAEPSSPGFRKSKIDHRSPRRFSTGVPVRARRHLESSVLIALVCLAPGFLMACASSRTTFRHVCDLIHAVRMTVP